MHTKARFDPIVNYSLSALINYRLTARTKASILLFFSS